MASMINGNIVNGRMWTIMLSMSGRQGIHAREETWIN